MGWNAPLQETLGRAASGADASGGLLNSASLDGLADEWYPEPEVL